jgi:hypothetical protein
LRAVSVTLGEVAQVLDRERPAGEIEHPEGHLLGPLDADLGQLGAVHLQHLQLEHHLGLGAVVRGDQPLGDAHHFGGVAHHEQVQLLVDEHILGLEHGAHEVQRRLDVGVFQVEGLHDQVLVLALLGRRVRVDEHRVLGQDLFLQLVGQQDQVDRVLHRHVASEDGGLQVAAHLAIEDEIDPGRARQAVEHQPQVGVAELDRHRLGEPRAQHRSGEPGLDALLLDLALQRERLALGRVLHQHQAQLLARAVGVAALEGGLGLGDERAEPLVGIERRKAGPGARIVRIDHERALVELARLVGLAGDAQLLGVAQDAVARALARAQKVDPVARVVRLQRRRGLEPGDAFLELPGVDHLQALAVQFAPGGASGEHECCDDGEALHLLPPRARVCLILSGRYMSTISSGVTVSTW